MFDVSEAWIMPKAVSHRVRMRDGWMDEVLTGGAALCGATFFVDKGGVERKPGQGGMEAEIGHGEAMVVLVRILQKCERCGGHRDWFATDNISFAKSYFYKL